MKKILIIEDDKMVIRIFQNYFAHNEVELLLAPEATEAIQKVQDNMPDLIILDVALAGQSGLDVLEKIKKIPKTALIPVVMFSAVDQEDIIVRAKALGAVDYIIKGSMSLDETFKRIKKYVE